MQLITVLGVALCFGVLYMRYQNQSRNRAQVTKPGNLRTVKILIGALLAWLTLSFTLRHMIGKLDGADHEPSSLERVVSYFSK
ncbi:MAG TPA: hypothetical protein VKU01_20815 [Bryobacteraceae bacterium]|nr:hypothetical protein [Bryobacteraceae bacterium]